MDWTQELEHERDFLRERLDHAEHKITHIENARDSCKDHLEADGLERMLHTVRLERVLLFDLLKQQMSEDALSLDALIMQRVGELKQRTASLSANWHRGHHTPPAYWEAESLLAVLTDLLRRYHAWHAGRPYYAEPSSPAVSVRSNGNKLHTAHTLTESAQAGYWFPVIHAATNHTEFKKEKELPDNLTQLDRMRQTIIDALHAQGVPDHHLDLIVQPQGLVIVKGYAHTADDHQTILDTILDVPGVSEVLADIQIVVPTSCPACRNGR